MSAEVCVFALKFGATDPTTRGAMDATPHTFRLERIRTLRVRSEDQAKQTLATCLQAEQDAQAGVRAAVAEVVAARDALALPIQACTDIATIRASQAYLERTEAAHRDRLKTLDGATRQVNKSRIGVTEASRARQSMDRLHDRSLAAHRLATGRAEAAILDEIALQTFRRGEAR